MQTTRRSFLGAMGAAAAGVFAAREASGMPLGLSAGVQLWSVREELQRDFAGTLAKLHAIGYRELELFEVPERPREFRKRVEDAGLRCVSGHFELMSFRDPKTVEVARELGLGYMVLVFPELTKWKGRSVDANFREFVPRYEHISVDDYRWNAEQLNRYGAVLKQHGLKAGFHNHAVDLKDLGGGQHGFDYLIQHTDPELVCFEMDCGHVIHAGYDPIAYLRRYGPRIEMLHLKDLVRGYQVSNSLDTEERDRNAEIGAGVMDWKALFAAAAAAGHVKHYFVEHEGKMDRAPLDALRSSYEYLQTLGQ